MRLTTRTKNKTIGGYRYPGASAISLASYALQAIPFGRPRPSH